MSKKKRQKPYETNMASEFFVLSTLHRIGLDPAITLGNKKAVDITLVKNGRQITIDVKGMASKTSWLLGEKRPHRSPTHYYILVTFLDDFKNLLIHPECYIIPSREISKLHGKQPGGKGYGILYRNLVYTKYRENWKLIK